MKWLSVRRSIYIPFCVLALFLSVDLLGNPPDRFQREVWNTYAGRMGGSEVQISLYVFRDGRIKGNYITKYTGPKIQLAGKVVDNAFTLSDTASGHPGGSFSGKFETGTEDGVFGTWTDAKDSLHLFFRCALKYVCGGQADDRYPGLFGSAEEVERFAKALRGSILAGDRDWVADHVIYPLPHLSGPGFHGISTRQELIRYFERIFDEPFKNKLKTVYTTNLFCKNGSVMIGDGELWVTNTPKSTKTTYGYAVMAINR